MHLIVDGANVIGSRPDGWWRDRPGAARRLAGRLAAALTVDPEGFLEALSRDPAPLSGTASGMQVHLVLEGAAAGVEDLPTHPGLDVVHASGDGDTAIAAIAADLAARGTGDPVLVVTADRALRDRVRSAGAATLGPSALWNALPPD